MEGCYLELAALVREKLFSIDPYFVKLADAMTTWVEAWTEVRSG